MKGIALKNKDFTGFFLNKEFLKPFLDKGSQECRNIFMDVYYE